MWADQNCRETIDYIYEAFVSGLPPSQRATARALPLVLGLSEDPECSWGAAFDDVAYLGLPMLVLLESDSYVSEDICIASLRAHMFSMLASLIHARFDSAQLEPCAELCGVLLALERERDLIVASLCELGGRPGLDCHVAEREARDAQARERAMFGGARPVGMDDYVAVTVAKHSPAFAAVLAAAAAADFGVHELGHLHELVLGVNLGLAARDEVRDWFERAQYGRSWAALLATCERSCAEVIRSLLELAASSFAKAGAAGQALGAVEFADWAQRQAQLIEVLLGRREQASGPKLARALESSILAD